MISIKVMQVELALKELIESLEELQNEAQESVNEIATLVATEGCGSEQAKEYLSLVRIYLDHELIGEQEVRSTRQMLQMIANKEM